MVQGFDNIGVCVTNLQSSVTFYELLGLREGYRNERGVLMAAGDARLFLFATRRADPPPRHLHLPRVQYVPPHRPGRGCVRSLRRITSTAFNN